MPAQINLLDIGVEIPETTDPDDVISKETPDRLILPGDVWRCGEHFVMCGDATKPEDVDRLLDGEHPELLFTDPPYGMKKESDGVTNDNLNRRDLLEFNGQWLSLALDRLDANSSAYVWGKDEYLMDLYAFVLRPRICQHDLTFANLIVWDKTANFGQLSPDMRCYSPASEECLFFYKGQQAYGRDLSTWYPPFEKFNDHMKKILDAGHMSIAQACKITTTATAHYFSRSQYQFPTLEAYNAICKACGVKAEYEAVKAEYEAVKAEWYAQRAYFDNTHDNMNNVWHFRRAAEVGEAEGHPTQKPVKLCERGILSSCKQGGAVLDVFGGSGSTLIAAENTGRRAYLLEIDPKWCGLILNRWERKTGQGARLYYRKGATHS